MKIETKAVHSGDRNKAGDYIPVTTPIHTASSYFYDNVAELDRVFSDERAGFAYTRYNNPTNAALEQLIADLEGGEDALACSSGMAALHLALTAVLVDRRKSVLAASAMYGATVAMLNQVFEPFGVDIRYIDIYDLNAVETAIEQNKPGCILLETIANPLLQVAELDRICEIASKAGVPVIVDNTFATPLIMRPLELGAAVVVHSATKYLSGHGDVLAGFIVSTNEYMQPVRAMSRVYGPILGPFECYLSMRGIKTFAVRMERQCMNASRIVQWLGAHPQVERVYFPQGEAVKRLFPEGMYGAMVSFELKGASREDVFRWMDKLKLIVRATSLGDVHTMVLYPAISSHRDLAPKQRERLGIRENLVRVSVGIEAVDDIIADLQQAFE